MPQRTIANGGGNWNSTATWVEGVVPTSSDFVVATATSGQLTINVSASCQYLNLSAYTNTLTMNNTITIGLASQTTSFGSGMSFAGTSNINCGVAQTFIQNTTNRIPGLQLSSAAFTFSTNIYVVNLQATTLLPQQLTGGNTIYISGNLLYPNTIGTIGVYGNVNYVLDGSGVISWVFGDVLNATSRTIEITGNYQTYGSSLSLVHNNTFIYTAGTAGSMFNILLGNRANNATISSNTLSINQPTIKLFLAANIVSSGVSNYSNTINLTRQLIIDSINSFATPRPYTSDDTVAEYTFSGNSVSATTLNMNPTFRTNSSTTITSGSTTYKSPTLIFDRLYTHNFTNMKLSGGGIPTKPVIKSNSAGNKVSINLGSKITTQIIDYNFTDINASGGEEIVAINGTITNSDNITNVYPTSSGGGGGSFTFVN